MYQSSLISTAFRTKISLNSKRKRQLISIKTISLNIEFVFEQFNYFKLRFFLLFYVLVVATIIRMINTILRAIKC